MAPTLSRLADCLCGDTLFQASRVLGSLTALQAGDLSPFAIPNEHGRAVVGVAWHSQATLAIAAARRLLPLQQAVIMTLPHRRGRMLARYAARLRVATVTLGDKPLERLRSVAQMLQLTRQGYMAFLAADGPDGPAFHAKAAIVALAQSAGAVLVPCALACSRALTLPRWDRSVVPLPGARVVLTTSAPIDPGRQADRASVENARAALERALIEVNCAARRLIGPVPHRLEAS